MKTKRFSLPIIFICLFTSPIYAIIIGGSVTVIDPPLNTGNDNQQINALLGFNERQHVLLTSNLAIDGPEGIIPAGTVVSSHYIIYDPSGSSSVINGDALVDTHVLGVIFNTDTLNSSDYLGIPTTNYLNPSLRGFEASAGDTATIVDPNTVSFHLSAGTPGDYARIITFSDSANRGPQFIMRSPQATVDGVHTNENGIGSVRLLFDESLLFDSDDVSIMNENGQSVTAFSTGSGSEFIVITFNDVLLEDRYTITVHDTVLSAVSGAAIDGDNDGNAGGDYIFMMEHRQRHDSDNDNNIDLIDLSELAEKWLWIKE